jgi:hypothetical protein
MIALFGFSRSDRDHNSCGFADPLHIPRVAPAASANLSRPFAKWATL